eukprot:Em0009g893a
MMTILMAVAMLTVLLLLSIPAGIAVPLSSFYSYGSEANDTRLSPTDDGSSSAISLPASFQFFGSYYSTIYSPMVLGAMDSFKMLASHLAIISGKPKSVVLSEWYSRLNLHLVNNNGDLSFGLAWSSFTPTQFPIPTYPVVAPYQADVDTRGIGNVWYRITRNATLLAKAANDIHSLTGASVSLQWLFIATWDHVGYYSYGTDKTNTFQAVLATDNVRSYAIFQYADGLIQWPSSGAQVGFNAGNNVNYVNIPGSRTPYILNIAGNSNVGISGQWIFLISQAVPSCGVMYNYNEGALALSGYVKCYDQPYSSYTTTRDLAACSDTQIVFVGAKSSNSSTVFAIGAFGSPYVFTATYSTTTAYYDPGGAYWYRYPSYSFGFADFSSVNLNSCDIGQGSNDCVSRFCWHLDGNVGGYRAGCTTGLNVSPTWRKVIYKGNNSSAMCNPEPCAEAYNETANNMAPSITVVIGNGVSLNITVKPESVSASLNSQVTLICEMTGCPSPQIIWYKDNVVISNVPSLVIPGLALSHRGFYSCKSGDRYSDAVRLSIKGVYQYFVHIQLNTSATLDITAKFHAYLTGRFILNNSANIILVNISYSGPSLDAIITLVAGNYSISYDLFNNELNALLLAALGNIESNITSIGRFDGCPLTKSCDNKYVWPESDIGTVNASYSCIQRHCGGTYSTGGLWEPVVFTCATDYLSCAIGELEGLLTAAVNSTEVAAMLLRGIDNLLVTNNEATYQIQDPTRLLKILNYYSNNAIINETTVFTGKTFAIQLEDISVSNGCFTGRNFSVNLGSVDTALAQNTTIFRSAISSNRIENTTASVLVLPSPSNEFAQNTTSIYRLTFYTFLRNVLFRSTEQEKEGIKLGSIIISVGGNAIHLAEKLQFSFQVVKDAKNAKPAQWINDSNQTGKWSTEGCTILSTQNNMFTTEVKLERPADRTTVYQGNFAMLLDLNPGSVTCPEADIVTLIGTVLSIISLLFFLVTYLCSKPLRKSEHGTVLINMSCALLCLYIVFLMAAYSKSVPALCGISAALVHYFMLVYFMWTAAEAVFLFIKLVKVLGNKINHFTLKAGLLSWLVPLGIVIISAGAGYRYYYNSKYCRASELPFYLGFITPFFGIYVFNWIMFTMIMVSLCKQSARSATVKADNGHMLRNVLIAAGVFVSCQGLLLLFFHGVRNKNAKKVWRSWVGLHSKSYTVTMSMRPGEEGNAMQSHRDQTASSQPASCPGNQPSVSQDDTSCEELKKVATTEEKLIDEGSFDGSIERYVISIEEKKEVTQKKVPRSFRSLSLLKKDASGAIPLFRSDSQFTKVLLHSEKDEDNDNSDLHEIGSV